MSMDFSLATYVHGNQSLSRTLKPALSQLRSPFAQPSSQASTSIRVSYPASSPGQCYPRLQDTAAMSTQLHHILSHSLRCSATAQPLFNISTPAMNNQPLPQLPTVTPEDSYDAETYNGAPYPDGLAREYFWVYYDGDVTSFLLHLRHLQTIAWSLEYWSHSPRQTRSRALPYSAMKGGTTEWMHIVLPALKARLDLFTNPGIVAQQGQPGHTISSSSSVQLPQKGLMAELIGPLNFHKS